MFYCNLETIENKVIRLLDKVGKYVPISPDTLIAHVLNIVKETCLYSTNILGQFLLRLLPTRKTMVLLPASVTNIENHLHELEVEMQGCQSSKRQGCQN